MEVLEFGHQLMWIAAGLLTMMVALTLIGLAFRSRRFVVCVRLAFLPLLLLIAGATGTLVWGFVTGQYDCEYVFGYSDRELPLAFKLAGLWGGLDGSLLFWTLILATCAALAALQHVWSSRQPVGRRMEPWFYLVMMTVLGFFVALVIKENPFSAMDLEDRFRQAGNLNIPVDDAGHLLEGRGLNPQLVNYWFVIHPPSLYLGFVIFTVPFAFGMAALITGELGDYWIRVTRRWSMTAWLFLTCGIILGGLWAYRQLGWGGYWAWDPVENASFLPWLAATAFLHSVMIQERRDMLKWWNVFLLIFTFFLTIEATYMTRAGEIDSVHAFGGGDLGIWFRCFKWAIAGSGLFLLFFRFWDLRGAHRLESLMSREAVFFINNLVLVVLALAIWFFSWLPNHTSSYVGAKKTFEPSDFNTYMTPALLVLLLLTAVGPSLGWVKTSLRTLVRNLLLPSILAALATGGVYIWFAARGMIGSVHEVVTPKVIADRIWGAETPDVFFAVGIYPTGLFLFLSFLIFTTVGAEFWRGVASRVRYRKEDLISATLNLVLRDNRRWGGYIVHLGLAILAIGIIGSALFRTENVESVQIGEGARIGPWVVTPVEANRSYAELQDAVRKIQSHTARVEDYDAGLAYLLDKVRFRVTYAPDGEATVLGTDDSEVVYELEPESRWYPKQGQWIHEVSIKRRPLEDLYIYFRGRQPGERMALTMYINPLMWLLYIGWVTMVLGGLFAILPFSGHRVGLSE